MSEDFSTGVNDPGSAAGNPTEAAAESAASNILEGSPEEAGVARGSVPVSVVQALRREMGRIREENRLYQAALLASHGAGRPGSGSPSGASPSKAAPEGHDSARSLSERLDRVSREMAFMRFSGDHPDFIEAINTHLPAMIREKPGLLKSLLKSPNPLAAAFDMVAKSEPYRASRAKAGAKGPDDLASAVSRILKNAEKAGAAGTGGRAPFSPADRIRSMTSEEFRAFTEQVKAQG
ncbi:MAG: hypothetical protein HZB23_08830 [Deltaproteobacteria bacterium]|nr:hypothetical protein [Deltaproteobacteria bacterium]